MVRQRRRRDWERRAEENRAAESAHETRQLLTWGGILLFLVAAGTAFYAWRETKVSRGASARPVDGDLARIEATGTAPDAHLRLGRHLAIYPAAVFEYELDRGEAEPAFVPDDTAIHYTLYPVISEKHPALAALEEWRKLTSEGTAAPRPALRDVAVLVKTGRYARVGSIPDESRWENGVQGLVVNRIRSLQPDESRLIRQSLPGVDLSRVLILEEGRTPTSQQSSVLLFVLAALVAAGGVACLAFSKRMEAAERMRRRRPVREEAPEERPPPGASRRSPRRRPRR